MSVPGPPARTQHVTDHLQRAITPLLRRDEVLDAVGEQDQADLVVVADRAQREHRAQLGRNLALEARDAAELTRGAQVDQQHHRQLALLHVLLDERLPHAGRHVPVDRAHVVAGDVFPDLGELHAAALEHAVVLAGKRAVDQPPRADVNASDLAERLGGQHARRRSGSTATLSNTFWIRSSAATPSASAS